MHRHRLSPAEAIEANVRRLSRGLELNPAQQARLRQILVHQYQQLARLRAGAAPGLDRTGAVRGIVDRTRGEIRAILDDAQKQKYSTDVPADLTAPSHANLEHWLEVRDGQTTQSPESPAKEN